MKNIKNQKGSISLFVILAMMFFLAFMLGMFSVISRRNAAQLEAVRETAKIYSSGMDANSVYDSMMATIDGNVIPISTPEQLKAVKEIMNGGSSQNYTINGQLYTYRKYKSDNITLAPYMLANDIILNLTEEIHGKNDISIYDYMLYDKTNYNINLNNHNIYYELDDGTLWKCIFYHDIGTSKAGELNTFANDEEAGKSYTATKYSILANGIDEFRYPWTDTTNYEFLLTYNCDNNSNGLGKKFDITNKMYQRWRQKNNPVLENVPNTAAGDGTVAELDNIHTGLGTGMYWGGLAISQTTQNAETFLDGAVGHTYWHYPVGVQTFFGNSGMPARGGDSASECLLLVRVK